MQLSAKKKGMSPIIATVLLIAFAVALGAIALSWGTGSTTPEPRTGECFEIKIEKNPVLDRYVITNPSEEVEARLQDYNCIEYKGQ